MQFVGPILFGSDICLLQFDILCFYIFKINHFLFCAILNRKDNNDLSLWDDFSRVWFKADIYKSIFWTKY